MLDPVLQRKICIVHLLSNEMTRLPVCVTQSDEPKFCCRINDKILRQFAHVGHGQTGPHHKLSNKITVRNTP